jgi:hypothetical protein
VNPRDEALALAILIALVLGVTLGLAASRAW